VTTGRETTDGGGAATARDIADGGGAATAREIPTPPGGGRYVEVAVPVPVGHRFHYIAPPGFAGRVQVGTRVLARFGPRKLTGVIVRMDTPPPEGVTPIAISDVLDPADLPALTPELVELCAWISDYYEAPLGEVTRGALPAGTGEEARTVFALTDAGRTVADGAGAALPAKQRAVLGQLALKEMPTSGMKAATRSIVELLRNQGLVEVRDHRAKARARLRRERTVKLLVSPPIAREQVARAPKRLAIIDALAEVDARAGSTPTAVDGHAHVGTIVTVDELERRVPGAKSHLAALAKLGLVEPGTREVALDAVETGADMLVIAPPVLTPEQVVAVDTIIAALGTPRAFLLHGVTGSGKTEVYLRVIKHAFEAGKTALVLVPEISLTPQLAARFRGRFGDQVAILHSGLSEQQRLGEWSRLRRGEARIVVGARSAVFAPLENLGVVVVDEEHDGSFKQDEGVRYHGRDVALVRAQRAGAVCVLGSATPSLETAAHAEKGTYGKLVLAQRPTARPMPIVNIIDLRTYLPDQESMLSAPLRVAMTETLAAGDQTILFLNRRGFATFVLCRACGHSFRCPHCSVSLTYHKENDRLACHYCGFQQRVPTTCPGCQATETIERKGLGTERIAAAVAEAFPTARVARLDRDVASGAKAEAILSRVARREVDILVGTQMVTKGHDFPGVTLVGVLCADTGLTLPDFRASERTFQLLAQVAGRAGRGDRPGRVLVQTYRPEAPAVVAAAAHDYAQFFAAEMAERAEQGFPPHGRLVAIRIDGPDEHAVAGVAKQLGDLAVAAVERAQEPVAILGPIPAPMARIRGRSRWQLWLRSADRHALRRVARVVAAAEHVATVRVALDVDPMSAM
jgi:primosomal protein N' (replication factor Y)